MTNQYKNTSKWLSIIGIGEDGINGLSEIAKKLLSTAETIVGGKRHLAMLPPNDSREKLIWNSPIETTITEIIHRQGKNVCVLATGDPLCYGIATTLLRQIPFAEMTIIPSLSAFTLACSRLGWSFSEVEYLSLCGRDTALLNSFLYPGAKILIFSANQHTPPQVAEILNQRGYSQSSLTILQNLGGKNEQILKTTAQDYHLENISDLNTIAIHCQGSQIQAYSKLAGLPDEAYLHDGQLTKKEIRAVTLAALAPLPGQLLWDVGAGCGSISIEWMRSHPRCHALAIEQHQKRVEYILNNCSNLGVPNLKIITGKAPEILTNLSQPDKIFIGGGITEPNLFETCWDALPAGGLILANCVTVESEQKVLQLHSKYGGTLTRIAIQRAEPVGKFLGWKPLAPVTQWRTIKPY